MNRKRDAQERAKYFPYYFFVVSLLVHLLAFLLLPLVPTPEYVPDEETIVDIDPALLEELESAVQRQVVESEKAPNTQEPKEAKYLGERNQTVEKETKAARVDTFQAGAPSQQQQLSLRSLAPNPSFERPPEPGEMDVFRKQQMKQELEQRKTGNAAATNDYLKDVSEGNRTLLNTKEFIYFGYYHRIRQRLEQAWNSKLRGVLSTYMRSGRRLASDQDYVTRLIVVLDENGKIKAVKVLEESGARDLDDAAVEAFNRAGPFPNPPKGLIDKDGLIKIRWDFILQS